MSTRSTTWFVEGEDVAAKVYRHSDGYPAGHGKELQEFFADVEAQTKDTRYDDPCYLSAKLVVWLADRFARTYDVAAGAYVKSEMLDFLSVGIVIQDPGDVEYVYVIHCDKRDDNGRPLVTCYERGGKYDGPVELGKAVPIPA